MQSVEFVGMSLWACPSFKADEIDCYWDLLGKGPGGYLGGSQVSSELVQKELIQVHI